LEEWFLHHHGFDSEVVNLFSGHIQDSSLLHDDVVIELITPTVDVQYFINQDY
jgi:hypothetical protein